MIRIYESRKQRKLWIKLMKTIVNATLVVVIITKESKGYIKDINLRLLELLLLNLLLTTSK